MKTVFDPATRDELITRITSLTAQNQARWGKMDVYQMIRHSALCDDMFLGTIKIKRVLIGRLIGKMVLKKVLKDDSPFGKNSPTSRVLKTTHESGDIELPKKEWINRIKSYTDFRNTGFIHPFFGPMTKEQVGMLAYKHSDHHLRQFGA